MTDAKHKPSGVTPSQTVGPYYAYGLTPRNDYPWRDQFAAPVATPDAEGTRIKLTGRVFDGDGTPVPDAMVEIWQADAQGRYAHPRDGRARSNTSFKGFGRSGTDKQGNWDFETIKPGAVPGPKKSTQAPHLIVCLFARGMLRHLYTRIYFPEDAAAHATDTVLNLVPADRRATLIAKKDGEGYHFDIRIQGADETVFFDI